MINTIELQFLSTIILIFYIYFLVKYDLLTALVTYIYILSISEKSHNCWDNSKIIIIIIMK